MKNNQFQQLEQFQHLQHTKILFISHTYPPIVGGVESQNYELYTWLSKIAKVKLVANKKRWLIPFFLVYASFYALFAAKKYDVILLGSCLLGNVGWLVKKFTQKPVVSVAHGLDLTWKNKFYQKLWIQKFIKNLDKLICVGNETIRVAKEKIISEEKLFFIPNGIDTEKFVGNYSKQDLEKIIGEKTENKKFILTSGRLAKRKGVAWMILNVFPKLPDNVTYIVAGDGPDKDNIKEAARKTGLESRIKLLGYVTDETRNILLNTCDLFVQPNIKVSEDMEGFGISVIEAASCKTTVIASDLEGLKDAVKDGQNGFLAEPENSEEWARKTANLLSDDNFRKEFGEKARQFVIDNFSWEIIVKKYLEEIEKTVENFKL
jgi:phosphatidylinositol alpha-1,6-mannosyltransferase